MVLESEITHKIVKEKDIYIFEYHHYALYPWALAKRKNKNRDVVLFTLDYHTDILAPFLKRCANNPKFELNKVLQEKMVNDINFSNDASLETAIKNLHNDEHIKTAIACNIIKKAFILSHDGRETPLSVEENARLQKLTDPLTYIQMNESETRPTPREERHYPSSDIYITDFLLDYSYKGIDIRADVILEDSFIQQHLKVMSKMNKIIHENGTFDVPYILDIDLDYFTTKNAVLPKCTNIFGQLVRNAQLITIAKESECVNLCSNGTVNSSYLLDELLFLIKKSMAE